MGISLMKCALVLCCTLYPSRYVFPTPVGPNSVLTRSVNNMKCLCNYAIISFHVQMEFLDLILLGQHLGHGPGDVANYGVLANMVQQYYHIEMLENVSLLY